MECSKKDLAIKEELGDKTGIAFAYGNMGDLLRKLTQPEKAIRCYEKLLTIASGWGTKR